MGILNNILTILSVMLVTDNPCSTVCVSVLVCTREDTDLAVKKNSFWFLHLGCNKEKIDRNISQTERLWCFYSSRNTALLESLCVNSLKQGWALGLLICCLWRSLLHLHFLLELSEFLLPFTYCHCMCLNTYAWLPLCVLIWEREGACVCCKCNIEEFVNTSNLWTFDKRKVTIAVQKPENKSIWDKSLIPDS